MRNGVYSMRSGAYSHAKRGSLFSKCCNECTHYITRRAARQMRAPIVLHSLCRALLVLAVLCPPAVVGFHDEHYEGMRCQPCGNVLFCAGGVRLPCPANSSSEFSAASGLPLDIDDCVCVTGFLRTNDTCVLGAAGAFYFLEGLAMPCASTLQTQCLCNAGLDAADAVSVQRGLRLRGVLRGVRRVRGGHVQDDHQQRRQQLSGLPRAHAFAGCEHQPQRLRVQRGLHAARRGRGRARAGL